MIPRSGKLLRLETMDPRIPIRSIYDHILSVAHSADTLLPHIDSILSGTDKMELSRVIAYHDLCEIILGDIPQFTTLNNSKRRRAQIMAQSRLTNLPDGYPEKVVNEFICLYLQSSERSSVQKACQTLESQSQIKKIAYVLDKIDPIVATWRYIHLFREINGFNIDSFLERMRAFFVNPLVLKKVNKIFPDSCIIDLINRLQNFDGARLYYHHNEILKSSNLFQFPEDVIRCLIEGRDFLYAKTCGP